MAQFFDANASSTLVRLEPVNSTDRIIEDHIGFTGYSPISPTGGGQGGLVAGHTQAAASNPLFGPRGIPSTPTDAGLIALSANATPMTLSDMVLFVTRGAELYTYNPYTGALVTYFGSQRLALPGGALPRDLAMRPDGLLYTYSNFGANDETTNNYHQINTGTGVVTQPAMIKFRSCKKWFHGLPRLHLRGR